MEKYSYPTTDTANDRVSPVALHAQVVAVSGLAACLGLVVQDATRVGIGCFTGGTIDILFLVPLTATEKLLLDGVVAAHAGVVGSALIFHASTLAVSAEEIILSGSTWQDLGGVVTSPSYFVADLARATARLVGEIKTVGATVQLRVVEDAAERIITPETTMANTLGAWALFPAIMSTVAPLSGQHLYRLQGRLNGSVSASIRYTSLSLLELET